MTAELRVGVNLMAQGWTGDRRRSGADLLAHRQRLLDRMAAGGIDHVMIGDHVTFRGGIGNDGLTDAASIVTATDHLGVYLAVYLLVLRHPVLVARQVVTVDQLAPGRLSLGLGIAGDDRTEVEACGVDPRTRGRRMDEALQVVRRLLGGERVTHEGEQFALHDVAVGPTPERPIPLVVGGRSDAALRRAGRLGDGWLGIWMSPERCRRAIAAVEEHAAGAGRSGVAWQHGMTLWCGLGPDPVQARAHVATVMEHLYGTPFASFERYVPVGSPCEVAERIAPYVAAGCRTVNLIAFSASEEAAVDGAADVAARLRTSGESAGS